MINMIVESGMEGVPKAMDQQNEIRQILDAGIGSGVARARQ